MQGLSAALAGLAEPAARIVETRAVAGAIPRFLVVVPRQLAAAVRAADVHREQRAVRVAVDAVFFALPGDDTAMSAGNVHRRGLRGHEQPPSDAAHGVAGALPEGGDGRGGEETLGRENVGVG